MAWADPLQVSNDAEGSTLSWWVNHDDSWQLTPSKSLQQCTLRSEVHTDARPAMRAEKWSTISSLVSSYSIAASQPVVDRSHTHNTRRDTCTVTAVIFSCKLALPTLHSTCAVQQGCPMGPAPRHQQSSLYVQGLPCVLSPTSCGTKFQVQRFCYEGATLMWRGGTSPMCLRLMSGTNPGGSPALAKWQLSRKTCSATKGLLFLPWTGERYSCTAARAGCICGSSGSEQNAYLQLFDCHLAAAPGSLQALGGGLLQVLESLRTGQQANHQRAFLKSGRCSLRLRCPPAHAQSEHSRCCKHSCLAR